jgi:hypothetical protein
MQSSTVRRLALGAGTAIAGGILGVLFMSTPAHADDGTQQPGGVLGSVVEVVDQVLPEPANPAKPEPPTKPAESEPEQESSEDQAPAEPRDEPADEPEQAPAEQGQGNHSEQTPPASDPKPETPPANPVGDVIDGVKDTVGEVVEVITTPPPAPPVVVVTPPVVAPTPTTTPAREQTTQPAVDTAPATEPVTDTAEPAVDELTPAPNAEVVDLPVVGPVAGSGTMLPGLAPTRAGDTPDDPEPQCTSDRGDDTTPDHGRGVVRTITDRRTGLPTAGHTPAKPCPTPAGPDGQAITAGSVKPPPPTGEQLVAISAAGAYSAPVLHRLTQLRPRGDIPAGRTEHPEPGPA